VATLGVDVDPSRMERAPRLVRGTHHADEEVAADGELRSEMVTVLADDRGGAAGPAGDVTLAGFLGGSSHDGTWRLRTADRRGSDGAGVVELSAEAFLGGARLDPGVERRLHPVVTSTGPDAAALLEAWASAYGSAERARVTAPYQVGWCSWYHYFGGVTERDVVANLEVADRWPFDVFQVDDGYQAAIGDWLRTDASFPSPLEDLAGRISASGHRPGIWVAPFLASPASRLATEHPSWIARYRDGTSPLIGMWHPAWGGATHTLDTTNPEVVEHLQRLAADLVAAGFTYLKLDFTYAPAFDGVFSDPTRTPAERVRAGYDAIRRGAGPDTFLLGCGAPLGAVVGVVDGNRIGADVAPHWHLRPEQRQTGPYRINEPATANAWSCTLARSFMHRRLWLNDPDCIMLRRTSTEMSADAVQAWAYAVGLSGGMALVSDDLAVLDGDARSLLDDVLALGRASDAEAVAGRTPRCPDLLDHPVPGHLVAAGHELIADPSVPRATLRPLD